MKNKIFRWLSAGSTFGLVLQLILPANFALAQAASIGNLRTWENTVTSSSATLGFSFTSAGYFRIDYSTTPDTYTSSSSIETLTNTSYPYYSITVSGLSPNTTYYYRLASKTLNGTEWGYSSSASFTTIASAPADTTPPLITSVSAILINQDSATINFTVSEGGYAKVEYGTGGSLLNSSTETVVTAGSSNIWISGLTAGTTYSYRIITRDSANNSGSSDTYTFTTLSSIPSAPTGLSTSGSTATTISIYWTDTATSETEFRIERRINAGSWLQTGSVGVNVTTYTDPISGAGTYEYRVKACNSAGCSTESNTVSRTMAASAPAVPTNLTASYNSAGTAVNVSWTDNSTDEWGFRLFRRVKGTTSWFGLASVFNNYPSVTSVSYADTYQLVSGTTYEYVVRSYNTYESSDSNMATAAPGGATTTDTTPPTINSGYIFASPTANSSIISFQINETGYVKIEYGTAGNLNLSSSELSVSPNITSSINLSSLSSNTTYSYRVVARDTASPANLGYSGTYTFTTTGGTTTGAPTVSGAHVMIPGSNTTQLMWTCDQSCYGQVEYGTSSTYTGSAWSPWTTAASLSPTIDLTGLLANTTYYVRIYAKNSSGVVSSGTAFNFTTSASGGTTPGASSLIGHWRFDGNGNNDVAGSPSAVIAGSASFKTSGGQLGGYAYIPSSSDYIRIPYNSIFDLPNSFTVEFWFRQRANQGFNQDLVYKGTLPNNYNFKIFRYLWNQYNNGAVIAGHTAANTGYWTQASNPNEPAHNTWHHVAYTKSSSMQAYYIDGVLVHSKDFGQYPEYGGPAKTPASDIIIGDSAVDTDIDNLKIYNYALSPSEIQVSGPFPSSSSADTSPPTVSGVWSSNVTANSANIYFTLNEAGYAKVEYGPNNTFNLSTSELSVPASVSSSIYLSGLSSGTTYSYRVVARDSANNSAPSGTYWFTTTGSTTATTTPSTSNTLPLGNASLRVTVKDTNGYIISGANVGLNVTSGSGWASGYTGAEGSYTFSGIASGSYNIGVSAPSNRTDLGYVTSYPVSLTAGAIMTVDITLPRSTTGTATTTPPSTGTAGIRVIVKDTWGGLVSGANVSVSNSQSGGSSWSSGYTGADGSYTASNLASGSYNIGVSAPPNRTDLGYITSYPAALVSGTTISVDVTLPRSTTTPTPTNDTTAPVISGVHIMDNNSYRTQVMWGTDDQSYGQVEYGETTAYGKTTSWSSTYSYSPTIDITGLSIGKLYHYRVRAKNHAGLETTSGDYTFTAGSSTTPTPTTFAVDFARSYPQPGAIEVPITTAKIHIEFTKSIDPNTVSGADVLFGFLGSTASSLSGSMDVFSNGFNFIPSSPMKSGTSYNFIVRSTIWAQTGEQLTGDYSISFTTAKEGTVAGQGTIKGTVKDGSGQPVSGAYVSLRAGGAYTIYTSSYYGGGSSSGFGYNQTTQTTTYGEYTFTNLVAGTYTLEAYPPSGGGGLSRPEPQSVTLAANETVIRDFAFGSSSRFIKGTVKFSDGSPVTDAEVSAYRREGSGWVSTPTGSAGEYTLAVGSGSWMVSIRPRYTPVPYVTAYPSGPNFYSPPPAPPAPSWVYTNPPVEVYIDTESKVVDFTVPRQSSNTSVSGTLERADGEPLADGIATVRFIGTGGFSVSTAVTAGGRFSTPINPGGYKVYVDLTDSNLSSPDFPPISVAPGEQKDIGTIRLYSANATISGRVTTPDGKGIPRVRVGGWKMNSSDNSSATTDEKGEYVLKVSPGEWTVGIQPSPDQPYTSTAPPQVVRVKGRVTGINFVLAASDGIVNGVVTDESGAILSDFYGFVSVGARAGFRLPGGAPVERGQFTLRLPAGSYILSVELPPNAAYTRPAPVPITVITGESVKVAMKLSVSSIGAVIGYLVDAAGNKITNAPFKVFASGEGGGWYSAITDEAIGYYKLKLPAGTWYIGYELAGEETSYERLGNRKKKVRVGAGEIVSLDLKVVRSSGRIMGVIRDDDGNGVSNVWIAIASSQFGTFSRATVASWRYLNGVNSDENGNFALNVPPGVYFVRAFVPPSMEFINPEEQKVRVGAGGEEKVELVLRARETTISGRTTIAGLPNWAFVWAWSDTGGYTETSADDSGNYKLRVSSGDTWHVAAMAEIKRDTYKASEVELVITRPGNYPLSLDLSPLGMKLPEPVTVSTEADQMTVAENPSGTKLVVPANAAGTEGALNVSITPQVLTPSQGADRVIGFGYEMEVRTPTGQEINTFNSELTVSIPYNPAELTRLGLVPGDLSLRFWDETSSTWQMIENAVVDETNHVVTGSVAHLTRFALVAATDTEPPAAPSQVKAKVADDGVVITWQKPKDKDLKYVKVYRASKAGALGEVVGNNLTAATYKDTGMARGTTYYYVVRAVDAAGNESINTAAVKAAVSGKGTLGKKAAKGIQAAKAKQKIEGTITDINLVASTLEIKNKAGKRVTVNFSPTLSITKDGKKVLVSTLKVDNTITAEAAKEGTTLTLLSAKAGTIKVKVKGKVKGAAMVGGKGKVTLKVSDVQGRVEGASIKRGADTQAVIPGGYLISNGRAVPVEHLLSQGNVIVEGVVEDNGITVTKITPAK